MEDPRETESFEIIGRKDLSRYRVRIESNTLGKEFFNEMEI